MDAQGNRFAIKAIAVLLALAILLSAATARAGEVKQLFPTNLDKLNAGIRGRVLDFTSNHGSDRRIQSASLGIPRDIYVYVPPNYDPNTAYPLLLWLHGFGGDEAQFARQVVRELDAAIVAGSMPPIIAVGPDASCPKNRELWCPGSWYINSRRGNYEDYIIKDVLGFVNERFNIRPEREAHIIAGWSMGGFGSYNLGFKHPDKFRYLVGIYPNLNLRYVDRDGHWGTPFNPDTATWLDDLKPRWILGGYPKYRFPVNAWAVFKPVWGEGPEAIARMKQENPIELVDQLDVRSDKFDLLVAYGRQDEYHVDNQVDSFLHHARERHLNVWVRFDPNGHHSSPYVNECLPDVLTAVGARLRHFLPDVDQKPMFATDPAKAAESKTIALPQPSTRR